MKEVKKVGSKWRNRKKKSNLFTDFLLELDSFLHRAVFNLSKKCSSVSDCYHLRANTHAFGKLECSVRIDINHQYILQKIKCNLKMKKFPFEVNLNYRILLVEWDLVEPGSLWLNNPHNESEYDNFEYLLNGAHYHWIFSSVSNSNKLYNHSYSRKKFKL